MVPRRLRCAEPDPWRPSCQERVAGCRARPNSAVVLFLDRALGWLKPGGRLVYCTCSLLPDEGEAQLAAALLRHPELTSIPPALSGIPAEWQTLQGGLRLRPDYWAERGGMDGFFMVCLRKPA